MIALLNFGSYFASCHESKHEKRLAKRFLRRLDRQKEQEERMSKITPGRDGHTPGCGGATDDGNRAISMDGGQNNPHIQTMILGNDISQKTQ